MGEERRKVASRGSPEGLREAIERTFAATAGPAAEGRDRARDLLDEVARRGRDAVDAVAKRLR